MRFAAECFIFVLLLSRQTHTLGMQGTMLLDRQDLQERGSDHHYMRGSRAQARVDVAGMARHGHGGSVNATQRKTGKPEFRAQDALGVPQLPPYHLDEVKYSIFESPAHESRPCS